MRATETKDLELAIVEEVVDGVTIFSLKGSLDVANVNEAKDITSDAFEQDTPKILFDLGAMDYIDSAGLGFLIGSLRRASQKGGSVKLYGLSAYMTGVFKIVNLHSILEVFDSRVEALKAYNN